MDWLEFLIPIVFILLWIFGNRAGKKNDEEKTPQSQGQYREREEEESDGQTTAADEARRIQEEIRRLIVSRQGGDQKTGDSTRGETRQTEKVPSSASAGQRSMGKDPHRPDRASATKNMENIRDDGAHRREPVAAPARATPGRDYALDRLREEEETVREKELEAERLRRKAAAIQKSTATSFSGANGQTRISKSGLNRRALRQLLRQPESTRNAILLMEILGTPVGQRKDDAIKPLWKS